MKSIAFGIWDGNEWNYMILKGIVLYKNINMYIWVRIITFVVLLRITRYVWGKRKKSIVWNQTTIFVYRYFTQSSTLHHLLVLLEPKRRKSAPCTFYWTRLHFGGGCMNWIFIKKNCYWKQWQFSIVKILNLLNLKINKQFVRSGFTFSACQVVLVFLHWPCQLIQATKIERLAISVEKTSGIKWPRDLFPISRHLMNEQGDQDN